MFNSIAVIFLQTNQDDTNLQSPRTKFFSLLQDIEKLDFNLHIQNIDISQLKDRLREYLKMFDIVISIGNDTKILETVAEVYDEHYQDDSVETNENPRQPYYTIQEEHNCILWMHRFYFIDYDSVISDFEQFLMKLKLLRNTALYSKAFKYEVNQKTLQYVEKLMQSENGIRTRKSGQNEIIVSSVNIDEINCLQNCLVSNFLLEESYVIEACEEDILNSSCSFIQEAIHYIKQCFDTYGPDNVFISFNGGKDCTVLLHLMRIILKRHYPDYKQQIFCMYIQSQKPFPEVTEFIERIRTFYNLDMHTLTLGIKDGLSAILQEKPNLKACLMGTRRSDPFSSKLCHFQATDNGWPEIMRVSPLLDWEFAHVWDYLLSFKVPYCKLYDEGYTSLGNIDNTVKNPELLIGQTEKFYPAYRLLTSTNERSGRM